MVIYGQESRTYESLFFFERGPFYLDPYLLLYSDGQVIIGETHGRLSEKQLSRVEMDNVLFNITQLGYFQLEDTYAADENNPLYIFPTVVPNNSYDSVYISVRGDERKSIRYMWHWKKYLIQPLQDIIYYLNHIPRSGLTPYQPDRLLVAIRQGRLQPIAGDTIAVPWPEDVTSLLFKAWDGALYLEGGEAREVFNAAGGTFFEVFTESSQKVGESAGGIRRFPNSE